MSESVLQIVHRYSTRIRQKAIYFSPNIPTKKLMNALNAYAFGGQREGALVLVDNTVFGSAKDGGLLTPTMFYAHNMMEPPVSISLRDIESVAFTEGMTCRIHINGSNFLETNGLDKYAMRIFADMLREIAGQFRGQPAAAPAEKSPAEALKSLKELFDAGVLSEEEYNSKRAAYLAML